MHFKESRTGSCLKKDNYADKQNEDGQRQETGLRVGRRQEKAEWREVKQVENELCQDAANNTGVAPLRLSCGLVPDFYCCCVSPLLAVILCLLRLLRWCPRVPGENKAEDWTRHLYSGALMESLRLKWQEVKGECTENSRQLHTTAAAVALPNHSTVMLWEVCVRACVLQCACLWVCVCAYVRMMRGGEWVRGFFVYRWLWKDFSDQFFLFTGIIFSLVVGFERFAIRNVFREYSNKITIDFYEYTRRLFWHFSI